MGWGQTKFKQMLHLLPEGWEAKAKELGAFKRARKIKTPEELLRLVLLYLTEGESFAGTSALVQLSREASLTKMAVFKRIQNCCDWLKWICEHIYRQSGLLLEKPQWLEGRNALLVDGSEDVRCGEEKQYFMLHYSLELFTLSEREFVLTDMKTGEKLVNFNDIRPGDIVLGDRIYCTLPGIAYLKSRQADYALRMRAGCFTIYDGNGEKIDLLEQFAGLQEGEAGEITARCIINGRYEPVRICALRKDTGSERSGLKRLKKENQRKRGGKLVSELQKGYNKYIIVITSLGNGVSAAQILELYRARWQIEITFKRLKTIFKYNEMPARLSENIRTWFYGKLLLAALCETLVNTGRFFPYAPGCRQRKRLL
jgi:hypothetical protein